MVTSSVACSSIEISWTLFFFGEIDSMRSWSLLIHLGREALLLGQAAVLPEILLQGVMDIFEGFHAAQLFDEFLLLLLSLIGFHQEPGLGFCRHVFAIEGIVLFGYLLVAIVHLFKPVLQ